MPLKPDIGLASVGIHPWKVGSYYENDIEQLKVWIARDWVRLVGECGLDKYASAPYKLQLYFFRKQIELAEQFCKPMIIHCVGYYNELFTLRKEMKPAQRWILHGFRGKPQLAEQALKAGCDLSFGEFFNKDTVRITPVEHLFVETDESKLFIDDIYKMIAEIKDCKVEELNAGEKLLNC